MGMEDRKAAPVLRARFLRSYVPLRLRSERKCVLRHHTSLFRRPFSNYTNPNFCLFKSNAHIITAAQNIKIKYHRFSRQKPFSNINRYPHEAGKMCPMASRKSGSKSIGNIIPESIIEGKNTSCAIIVSFA